MTAHQTVEINSIDTVLRELVPLIEEVQGTLQSSLEKDRATDGAGEVVLRLAEIRGTLQVLELLGPATLAGEMQALADALGGERVNDVDAAVEVLLKAVFKLPDYLDRMRAGHRDVPAVLLPLINELRVVRGESGLDERAVFFPHLERRGGSGDDDGATLQAAAKRLRPRFQRALLGWYRGVEVERHLGEIGTVLQELAQTAGSPAAERLWRICGALIESLADQGLEADTGVKILMGRVERLLSQLVREGQSALESEIPLELLRNLLYHVARSASDSARVREVKQAYQLDELLPDSDTHADFEGPNRELLGVVGDGIRDDLAQVKDAVELYVHSEDRSVDALEGLPERLNQVAETFSMLGLQDVHDTLDREAEVLARVEEYDSAAADERLQQLADVLLRVENDLMRLQSGRPLDEPADPAALAIRALPDSEYRPLLSGVVAASLDDLARVREAIGAYCDDPQTGRETVAEVPELLHEVRGAVAILPLTSALHLIEALERYVREEFVGQGDSVDDHTQLLLADVVAGFEYYLEAVDHDRAGMTHLLESAHRAMDALAGRREPVTHDDDEQVVIEAPPEPDDDPAEYLAFDSAQFGPPESPESESPESESPEFESPESEYPEFEPAELEPAELDATADEESSQADTTPGTDSLESDAPGLVPESFEPPAEKPGVSVDAGTASAAEDDPVSMPDPPDLETPEQAADLGEMEAEPTEAASVEDTGAPATPESEPSAEDLAPGVDPMVSGSSQMAILGDETDEEIVEVFIEEALGELDRINEHLPRWKANPGDEEALIVVRRAYHTLKGGGRLIGAELIGEFSWAMENMLNRIIDRSINPTSPVLDTLDEAAAALPQMIEQLQGNRAPIDGIDALIERAHALSRGEQPPPPSGGGGGPHAGPGDDGAGRSDNQGDTSADDRDGASAEHDEPADDMDAEIDAADEQATSPTANVEPITTAESREGSSDPNASDSLEAVAETDDPPDDADDTDETDETVMAASANTVSEPAGSSTRASASSRDDDRASGHQDDVVPYVADDPLINIFLREAAGHVATLQRELAPTEGEAEGLHASDDVLRALHTLVGSAQTVEATAVADLTGRMEQIVKASREQDYRLEADTVVQFRAALVRIDEILAGMSRGETIAAGDLNERLDRIIHAMEQANSERDEGESELLDIFIEEGEEILEECDRAIARWREEPDDIQVIADLQRGLHTLKGGARMASFPPIADLTHEIESLVNAIADGACRLTDEVYDLLQEAVDALTVLLEQARNRNEVARIDWLVDDLRVLREQNGGGSDRRRDRAEETAESSNTAAGSMGQEPDTATAQTDSAEQETPRGEASGRGQGGESTASAPGSEQIRVQSDLLDNLVNFAGEVSIYHSRINEQLGQYRFNINEFDQTVNRLRAQLRDMENETESQIRYTHAVEREQETGNDGEGGGGFDPLEFDRYTRLNELSRSLSESVGDLDSLKEILDNVTRDAETLLLQQSRVSSELQDGLMQTRMVRFDGLRARLARIARQTASSVGKQVHMEMSGGELELDRSIQERIVAPLEHVLRNAVSHGIESPEKRRATGKPEQGTIRLDLHRGGTDIVIEISDDGGGIDPAAVRRKGIEKGLIDAADERDDNEIIKLILETGFSTSDEVTQISGRGVGMDVVDAEIRRLGGTLGIHTEVGTGTRFTVRLPVTLAINQAVMVQAGDDTYAIPIASIEGVAQVTAGELKRYYVDSENPYHYAGNDYRLQHLGTLLSTSDPRLESEDVSYPVIMIRAGDDRVALHVDGLVGRREVVVKPLGAPLNMLSGLSGATIQADGSVILILDIGGLLRTEDRFVATTAPAEMSVEGDEPEEGAAAGKTAPTVLVVDDSITIRKVTGRILERNGMELATAKDGVDALAWMAHSIPDLILLDIEMPRMDGYEVASYVRGDDRLANVPIIMITSRTGEKHRERAAGLGVDRYLGKPYQEGELMDEIRAVLAERSDLSETA